jgi:hypothetical protein
MMLLRSLRLVAGLAALFPGAIACGEHDCYGPVDKVEHVRHVKRMQPGAPNATYGPKAPLEWGQVNFLHTVSLKKSSRRAIRLTGANADRHPRMAPGSPEGAELRRRLG